MLKGAERDKSKVSLHNSQYWSETNTHWQRELTYLNRWSINVRRDILNGKVIGPFFFEGSLTGEKWMIYLFSYSNRINIWYQQDGCSAYFATEVRDYLDGAFSDKWIGRGVFFFGQHVHQTLRFQIFTCGEKSKI